MGALHEWMPQFWGALKHCRKSSPLKYKEKVAHAVVNRVNGIRLKFKGLSRPCQDKGCMDTVYKSGGQSFICIKILSVFKYWSTTPG